MTTEIESTGKTSAIKKRTKAVKTGQPDTSRQVAPPRKKKYVNNADLMTQIAISRESGKMTDELGKMLFMLCQRYSTHPDYANIYSYKEDMVAFAMLTVVKVWRSFNPERSNNPFAYFTQIIRHAFYQYLNQEKRQREVKDEIRIDIGEVPSFTYMENFREDRDSDYDGTVEESEADDDVETKERRPGYDATRPGEVTEITYTFNREDDVPDGMVSEE
jgi:DNA-directed RNA polymerase specialized sigma24 family protein